VASEALVVQAASGSREGLGASRCTGWTDGVGQGERERGTDACGVEGYTWRDCWNDYRLAVVTRALFMPMWQWSSGQPPRAWWASLECALQAFEDLGCAELVMF